MDLCYANVVNVSPLNTLRCRCLPGIPRLYPPPSPPPQLSTPCPTCTVIRPTEGRVLEEEPADNRIEIGVGVGVTIVVIIAAILAVVYYRYRRKKKEKEEGKVKIVEKTEGSQPYVGEPNRGYNDLEDGDYESQYIAIEGNHATYVVDGKNQTKENNIISVTEPATNEYVVVEEGKTNEVPKLDDNGGKGNDVGVDDVEGNTKEGAVIPKQDSNQYEIAESKTEDGDNIADSENKEDMVDYGDYVITEPVALADIQKQEDLKSTGLVATQSIKDH